MSYAETLCEKSLHLIFEDGVEIYKNYRPNWLINPKTGKPLEIDFYIPHINVAFEIQGPHHYDDSDQIYRDFIKQQILTSKKIYFIKLGILQVDPNIIRSKILGYTCITDRRITFLKRYDDKWRNLREYKDYKEKILTIYGCTKCTVSPYINESKDKKDDFYGKLDQKIMFTTSHDYIIRGKISKITPIEIVSDRKVKCRVLGSNEIILVKKKIFIKNLGP